MRTNIIVVATIGASVLFSFASAQTAPPLAAPQSTKSPPLVDPPEAPPSSSGTVKPPPPDPAYPATPAPNMPKPTSFATLDRKKTGAIKIDEARSDAWLSAHFAQCDVNHNDEVTQSEYENCTAHLK